MLLRIFMLFFLAGTFFIPVTAWASKRIVVDLTRQVAIAYEDGKVKFYGRISSGRSGMETPTGSFRILEKEVKHVSNLWPKPNGGATMPYMMRITRDGVALHLDPAPDYPASHGCIRLRNGFAQRMYAWAPKWTPVDVIGHAPLHSPPVALPSYARSQKVLRRSRGGGTGNPLDILSGNPKRNGTSFGSLLTAVGSSGQARRQTKKRIAKRSKSVLWHHARPLDVFTSNYKRHGSKMHTMTKPHTRKRRKPRRKRNRHPNPLHTVSSH